MRKILYVLSSLLGLLLLFLFMRTLSAETIAHHGYMVNAEGSPVECLACHDGSAATSVANCVGINCNLPKGSPGNSHPVSKPYPPEGREDDYLPANQVTAAGIRLVNGQVSCISCHDLKNPGAQHLIINNGKSTLCLSCHKK
jgi:predicted CXXCH cytochrome family protein